MNIDVSTDPQIFKVQAPKYIHIYMLSRKTCISKYPITNPMFEWREMRDKESRGESSRNFSIF